MEQGHASGITSSSPAPVLSMEVAVGALGPGQPWLCRERGGGDAGGRGERRGGGKGEEGEKGEEGK